MPYPLPEAPTGVDEAAWAATVAEVRAFCGWHIAPVVTETLTVDGPGGYLLVLPTLRLVGLVSVTNEGRAVVDPEWSESGMVRHSCWSRRFRGVVAEVTHGYEEWPAELVQVMKDIAGATAAYAGIKSVASSGHQVTFETSLRSDQRDILGRYQLPFIP